MLDLLRGFHGRLGQAPDLRRDHCEVPPGVPVPRDPAAGIQGQQIGPEGDDIDDADDMTDLSRRILILPMANIDSRTMSFGCFASVLAIAATSRTCAPQSAFRAQ